MKRKIYLFLPFVLAWMTVAPDLPAQVRIGENKAPAPGTILDLNNPTGAKGGLMLSSIDLPDLGKIPNNGDFYGITAEQDENLDLAGTIVYNTNPTTGTGIYLWNGKDWMKLNLGGTVILTPDPGNNSACNLFKADGSCENKYMATDPPCKAGSGDFTFTWISGETFIDRFNILDAGAGIFTLSFLPNDRASNRQALLMITSGCGNNNIFVFTQEGDVAGCNDPATAPRIMADNSFDLCGGGAAYLYLDARPPGTYIWTLNDVEVGRGTEYIATRAGRYIVYANKIGCTTIKPDTAIVSLNNGTSAPSPVRIVVNTNNGVACGAGSTVKLIASTPLAGNVIWYKDGVRQPLATGEEIDAGKGEWFAVVEDGGCSSTPSAPATVTEDLTGGAPVALPIMRINGLTGGWSFCKDGSIYLELANPAGDYDPAVNTITWYADNTEIGQGSGFYYKLPDQPSIVIRCRATGAGCASESYNVVTISVSPAPAAPAISGTPVLCGGTATLTANTAEVGATFTWYENGVPMSGPAYTGPSIIVSKTGNYTATVTSAAGCTSQQSAVTTVTLSDYSVVSWIQHPANVDQNTIHVYEVGITNGPATDYNWTVTGDAIMMSGQGTSKLQVQFGLAHGLASVEVSVKNACGEALPTPLICPITITAACPTPIVQSPATDQTIARLTGQTVTFTANFADESGPTYQWYKGAAPLSGKTGKSLTLTSLATADAGDYTCVVTNGCAGTPTATSKKFTLTVAANPSTMPTGAGSFSGKLCFDIAETGSAECGELNARQSIKANFANLPAADKLYTFKSAGSGTVRNVRFVVIDNEGCVASTSNLNPVTGDLGSNGTATVTLNYKTTLNSLMRGRSSAKAAVVTLYAVYYNGSQDVSIPLTIKIQDCACCGAKTVTGGWLNFMCHNLGANESLDPFTPNPGLKGDLYQWGRKTDGHEKTNSATSNSQATSIAADAPATVKGKFIMLKADWLANGVSGSLSRWGDGTQDENPKKGINDPCPPGWKVPSQKQWASIYMGSSASAAANTWTWVTTNSNGSGYKVGQALFLPASGWREFTTGGLSNVNNYGFYWSSTNYTTSVNSAYHATLRSGGINMSAGDNRALGASVRCISE